MNKLIAENTIFNEEVISYSRSLHFFYLLRFICAYVLYIPEMDLLVVLVCTFIHTRAHCILGKNAETKFPFNQ